MIQSGKNVECNYLFLFMFKYYYPLMEIFYSIKIIGKENLKLDKQAIYIFKHTTHNYDIIPGLFTLYKELKKPVRGLGHYLIYFLCPHYTKLGIVVGDRYIAEKLLENKESISLIPGGAEEMASSLTEPNKLNWISKSGNYKTGFAKLSIKYDVDIIPMAAKNAECMVFSPVLYLINKTDLITNFNTIMNKYENSRNIYIILHYIKVFFTLIFASLLVIPIPVPLTFVIGEPIKKIKDEDILDYTKRCEFELQKLVYKANSL
jgi:1-acyl-sn-glycerol-3-phosphate acyltransferase